MGWRWVLIRGWGLINFSYLQGGRLFEVGAYSRLGANNRINTLQSFSSLLLTDKMIFLQKLKSLILVLTPAFNFWPCKYFAILSLAGILTACKLKLKLLKFAQILLYFLFSSKFLALVFSIFSRNQLLFLVTFSPQMQPV